MNYDIIGDIHGQAGKLEHLLQQLGYTHTHNGWQHPSRTAVFVGDFVDRGPEQIRTLEMVKQMVDNKAAIAVLGNHEFNAMAWFTPHPSGEGHLRQHTDKNHHQHTRFLEEVGNLSGEHQKWIEWFYTLPLWFENEHIRVIHACWHPPSMAVVAPLLGPNNTLTTELLAKASAKGTAEFEAVEILCKGMEVRLPNEVVFTDKQGIARVHTRTAWWDHTLTTYKQAALVGALAEQLPDKPLPTERLVAYDNAKPVFFGHYWMTGEPVVLGQKLCCVDYSAAVGDHPLVAYCFDGEEALSNSKFVYKTLTNAPPERIKPRAA